MNRTSGSSEPSGTAKLAAMTPEQIAKATDPMAAVIPPTKACRVPEFSVVVCSPPKNADKLKQTLGIYQQSLAGEDYEIVAIDDARSLAEGYLRGVERSRGRVVVFSHDDAAPVRPFAAKLRSHLRRVDVVGGAGTDRLDGPAWFTAGAPHVFGQVLNVLPPRPGQPPFLLSIYNVPAPLVEKVQAIDGFWMAAHRDVLRPGGAWFDPVCCPDFHYYDLDFSFGAFLRGVRVGVACDLGLLHASSGGYGDPKWAAGRDRFLAKYAGRIADHKPLGFQFAAVTGDDINALVGVMDGMVERAR